MKNKTLFVGQNKNKTYKHEIYIDQIIENMSEKDIQKIIISLINSTNIEQQSRLHETSIQYICRSGLPQYIYIYQEISKYIEDNQITRIDYDLNFEYSVIIYDLINQYSLKSSTPNNRLYFRLKLSRLFKYITLLITSIFLISDQLVSIILKLFREPNLKRGTMIVPKSGRYESMHSVIKKLDCDFDLITTQTTVGLVRQKELYLFKNKQHKYTSINVFSNFCVIKREISYLVHELLFEMLINRKTEARLACHINNKYSANLNNTVYFSFNKRVYNRKLMRSILYSHVVEDVFSSGSYQRVILDRTTAHRGIIRTARKNGVEVYCIPHTIAASIVQIPSPPGTTLFVSGKLEKEHWSKYIKSDLTIVASGRPYFESFNNQTVQYRQTKEPIHITIATQPFDEKIRHKFVSEIIKCLEDKEINYEATIKIHPNENLGDYNKYKNLDRISISDIRFEEHIPNSDITFTINSNTGFESIVSGVPCVCVNFWAQKMNDPIYAKYGPIPIIYNEDSLCNLVGKLNEENIDKMKTSQQQYIYDNYSFSNASKEIVNVISNKNK